MRALRQSWAHPLIVLYVGSNELGVARVGISTSKRVGKAIARNRAKRLIREAVRGHLPAIPGGRDLVFVARQGLATAEFGQVSEAVQNLLARAGLLPRRQGAPSPSAQAKHEMDSPVPD